MKTILTILRPFFYNPNEDYHIREISRITKINHTTIRKYLDKLVSNNILRKKASKPYPVFCADVASKKYLNLKLYYNLEKLRRSNLVEKLEEIFDYPVIVLFGSYAKSLDDINSDVDIFVLVNKKPGIELKPYEKILERHINLHLFTDKEFSVAKTKNPELINSICNGITLSGQLEVIK